MAAKIKKHAGIDATLLRSSGGVFEVAVEGVLMYSKKATGEFPDEDALAKAVAKRAAG